MKLHQPFIVIGLFMVLFACKTDPNHLSAVNSQSFPEKQINLNLRSNLVWNKDSLIKSGILTKDLNWILGQLDEMHSMAAQLTKTESDSDWVVLVGKWNRFNDSIFGVGKGRFVSVLPDEKLFSEAFRKWAELNAELMKLSEQTRFADAFENLVYGPGRTYIPENLLKSVVYTHVFDQVYVNIIGSSSVVYPHTTGGLVKIIQETNYPLSNEITLRTESGDFRYMDIFIRIPSWAVNPTVTHGNVKYVANPGEYCEVSRKWKTGDEIRIVLSN